MQMSKLIHITHSARQLSSAKNTTAYHPYKSQRTYPFHCISPLSAAVFQIPTVGSYIGVVCNCEPPAEVSNSH